MLYIILGGAYMMKINDMESIATLKMDRALVYGNFTNEIIADLRLELEEKGFKGSELEIGITPSISGDMNDSTYAPRGTEMELRIVYKKPHWFYYVNKFVSPSISESKFYIGVKKIGMSERW